MRLSLAVAILILGVVDRILVPCTALSIWMVVIACANFQVQKERILNSGIAGFLAVADSWSIAILIGLLGKLDVMGFFVLAPCIYAFSAQGSHGGAMAPLAAAGLITANAFFRGGEPTVELYGQALGVLGIGALTGHPRALDSVVVPEATTVQRDDPELLLHLRQSYRELKGQFQNLERRAVRDRISAEVLGMRLSAEEANSRIADRLRKLFGVADVSIYRPSRYEAKFVVASTTESAIRTALELDSRLSVAQVKSRLESTLRQDGDLQSASVVITFHGKVAALIALSDPKPDVLAAARRQAEDAGGLIAELFFELDRKVALEIRAKTAEALYEVATVAQGASSPNVIAERLFGTIFSALRVDHLGVSWMDGDDAMGGFTLGEPLRLLDVLRFANGQGVHGWRETGFPEIILFSTMEDDRCPRDEAVKRRIGSFAVFPINFSDHPYGFVTLACRQAGGFDIEQMETLRVCVAELGQAIARLKGHASDGLMTKTEFAAALMNAEGAIVVIEPLKRTELIERYGQPTVERVYRDFARRTRAKLPKAGALIRRESGALVAFLRDADRQTAEIWANEVAATASLLSLNGPSGREFVPFAVRAKVAAFNTQSFEFSPILAA